MPQQLNATEPRRTTLRGSSSGGLGVTLKPDAKAASAADEVRCEISRTHDRFCRLLKLAEDRTAAGDLRGAAALAQVAARLAYPANTGLFGSSRLERLLLTIGKSIPSESPDRFNARESDVRKVLHVLSYAKPVGGDTRFVWRWMQLDQASCHSAAITSQMDLDGREDVPESLSKAASDSGGFTKILTAPTTNPIEQARELRALCRSMDIVVLHVYPYDIVPILALAVDCGNTKILFCHQSDHTFWVGGSVSHRVINLRSQPDGFLESKRGLDSKLVSVLPIPLPSVSAAMPRSEAKRALGYAEDDVLLLTIASPFKYSAPGHVGFLELVTDAIANHPQAHLIAIGPDPKNEAWRAAASRTDGRMVALGRRWDTALYYAAADAYLDSVPFSSSTSLLEAGSHGAPLLGYQHQSPDLRLMGPGAPGLDGAMIVAEGAAAYRDSLSQLLTDQGLRHALGNIVREQIRSRHTGVGWSQALERVYEDANQTSERACLSPSDQAADARELSDALFRLYPTMKYRKLVAEYVGALPDRSRFATNRGLLQEGLPISGLSLLPGPIGPRLRQYRRWALRTWGKAKAAVPTSKGGV